MGLPSHPPIYRPPMTYVVDSMEHAYSMHPHTRSLSSLASTIMPVPSDASAFTSVTASPMEAQDPEELPIELKIPLPPSIVDSDEEVDTTAKAQIVNNEDILPEDSDSMEQGPVADTIGVSLPTVAHTPPLVSLEEVAHLVELERCQRSRTYQIEADIDRLSLSCGLNRRLISTLSIAYGNMIDQYKIDDQAGFGGLYEACEQLKVSCDTAGASTNLGNDAMFLQNLERRSSVQLLPPNDQSTILAFLTRIRTDQDLLSDRISNMSHSELTALTSTYHPAGIDFSVLPNHSHGKTQFYSRDSQMMKLSRRMDNLHHFHNQDPLFALLHGVFDSSARPGSSEYFQRTNIWSTVCARNFTEGFTEGKQGSDELAIATLDAFANFQDWSMKPLIETYLMRILSEGSFLLDPDGLAIASNDSIEMHKAKAAVAEAGFFEKALTDLFELLAQGPRHQAIPDTALYFIHATLRKVEDHGLRLRAMQFIVYRWYFATFISSIVVYPELRGLMMTHHISGSAREIILRQLVVRMQQRVFDVILQCNSGTLVRPEQQDSIMTIFRSFEPPVDPRPPLWTTERDENFSTKFLMLSPQDIVGLIHALYPDRSFLADTKEPHEIDVAPPSTAGSSTLNASTSDSGSALASSSAPSTSGTSVTSRTIVSENLTNDAAVGKQDSPDISISPQKEGAPSKNPLKRDLPWLLKSISRRLTHLLGPRSTSKSDFSHTAWAFIYYSGDGTTLSLSPLETGTRTDSEAMDPAGDLEALKNGIVKLLGQADILGAPELISPIKIGSSLASDESDPIAALMKASVDTARSSLDFGTAHFWWQTLGIYRRLLSSTESKIAYTPLLCEVADDLRRKLEAASQVGKVSELRLRSLKNLRRQQKNILSRLGEQRKALRIKMWYTSDVRHSATYEEALHVTRALRAMASSKRARQPASMTNWARQRLRGSSAFARSETQTLEAISAPKEYGGQTKLADEQVEITSRWLTRRSIENFCKGEERIHRFCFEIQKSISKMAGPNSLKNPVLWSSNLFRREKANFDAQRLTSTAYTSSLLGFRSSPTSYEHSLHSAVLDPSDPPIKALGSPKTKPVSPGFGGFWNASQPFPPSVGHGLSNTHPLLPPTPTSPPRSWSSNPFAAASPLPGAVPSPSYSGFGDRNFQASIEADSSPAKLAFAEDIRMSLRSLLISDLGHMLWKQGTETDAWVNETIAYQSEHGIMGSATVSRLISEMTEQDDSAELFNDKDEAANKTHPWNLQNDSAHPGLTGPQRDEDGTFPFVEAYEKLLQKMSLSPDPRAKLQSLYELEDLIIKSLKDSIVVQEPANPPKASPRSSQRLSQGNLNFRGRSVPRTKATCLEEVVANCAERRAATLRSQDQENNFVQFSPQPNNASNQIPDTDDVVNAFLSIFRDPKLRPLTLFRDLQYIAAFIPSETLDQTAQGKAFWDAGLAALALKEDLCETIFNRANQITAYHISSSKSTTNPLADINLAQTTLRDAANLWLITAKEGSPAAARELGLFYLTHPELLPRVTMPFSKAKDVYKSAMPMDARVGDREKGALDRSTFAVVFHWMEFAANGGDRDARDFLKGNGELNSGRR